MCRWFDSSREHHMCRAHVAEWPMAAVQKTAGEKSPEGSNPSMSATASKIFDFSRGI